MFNNAVQLASHSLSAFHSCSSLISRPIVITSALTAIFVLGILWPTPDKIVHHLNSSLCERLNDSEWESLPLKNDFNDFKQKILFSNLTCTAVTEKLLSELTKDFRKVAFDMGHTDPSAFSLQFTDDVNGMPVMGMGMANVLFISPGYAEKWWNLESSHQRKRIRGIFAHEIAHRILKHNERAHKKSFETLGVSVNSLDDVNLVVNAMEKQVKELSFLRAIAFLALGIPFLKSDYSDPSWRESTKQLYANAASLFQRNTSSLKAPNEVWFNYEMEADLLMMRVPSYARGGIDELENIIQECEKNNNSTYCDGPDFNNPKHPPLKHRLSYLTDALCEKYPSLNQDICQCSATDKQV